ncbi:MAG: hypothetical protein MJH10_09665 [Epibacterium sp.]|nr:hypothetical protein [Epibacterium sp.]NQX73802.1 hypothetical protein [Epibacterium sp.]
MSKFIVNIHLTATYADHLEIEADTSEEAVRIAESEASEMLSTIPAEMFEPDSSGVMFSGGKPNVWPVMEASK